METQHWEGMNLDKDLLGNGQSLYSPVTCCFIPGKINTFIQSWKKFNGLPAGVSMSPNGKRYKAYCGAGGSHYLGTFDTAEEAHAVWKAFKHARAKVLAKELRDEGFDDRICVALENRYV